MQSYVIFFSGVVTMPHCVLLLIVFDVNVWCSVYLLLHCTICHMICSHYFYQSLLHVCVWILFSLAQRSVRQWSVLCANGLYLIWRYVELAAGQWNPHSCVHGYLANIGINFSIYYHQISYKNIWIFVFLPAWRYASAGNSDRNVSVRPSVCLSRAGIVSKRRKLASWFLHLLVAPRL